MNITQQLATALSNQKTSDQQYDLLKTILEHYNPTKPLGEAAINFCYALSEKNHHAQQVLAPLELDTDSFDYAVKFAALGFEHTPEEEEEEPMYTSGCEDEIETLINFCVNGMELADAMKCSGFQYPLDKPTL